MQHIENVPTIQNVHVTLNGIIPCTYVAIILHT